MNNSRQDKARLWTLSALLGALFLFTGTSPAHATPKELPVPSWLNTVQVAETMIINGLPSSVQHFETNREIDELLDFYRKQWNDGSNEKPGYREAHISPWYVISRLDNNYLYTVQVQQAGAFSIKGYLAVADLKAMQKPLKSRAQVPSMSGSSLINDVTSFDPGKKGRTLMLVNNYSISSNSNFYRRHYLDRGWTKILDMDRDDAFIMAFKKRNKETHLVISHMEGATQIVMNTVEGI